MRPERPNLRPGRPGLRHENLDLRPERPNLRSKRPGLRPERLDLRPEILDLSPERLDLRPKRLDLRPEMPYLIPERPDMRPEGLDEGGMNKRTNNTNRRTKVPLCSTGLRPLWGRCSKSIKNAPFPTFQLDHHDGRTDKVSYRVARPQLKSAL